MTRKIQFDANNRPVEVLDSGGGQVDSVGAGTAISVTGTLSDPVVNVVIADLISSDTPNTATTGSDNGLLVPPVDPAALISADTPNALSVGSDGKLVATGGGGGGQVDEVIPGPGVSVDSTDPERPIVSAKGGGTGIVAITFTNAPFEAEASIADPITVPYDWEIVGWRLRGGPGQSGTATVDWLLLNDQDDIGVSITASLTPTVNGTSNESTTLTGWTTTGTAGKLLQAVLTNVTGFRSVVCELLTVRT